MTESRDTFTGRTALVTGAASGIGRAIACALAARGADVVLVDVAEEGLRDTAAEIESAGRRTLSVRCDMGSPADIDTLVAAARAFCPVVHILVNGAGIGDTSTGFDDLTTELWDSVYAVNVRGPFLLARQIARDMIERKIAGRIINISSTEGKTNRAGSIAYASSKSALNGLTQALAIQLAPHDITVNAICPGLIDTPLWHRSDTAMDMPKGSMVKMVVDASIESRQLKIMRAGHPEEIAAAVLFLASPGAAYITGQAINVCGGLECH